jgi:nucleoside-diphosphate-sugar epimerase
MKILLVGGNGFLGRSLGISLKAFGHEVLSAGRDNTNNYQVDLLNTTTISQALLTVKPDLVVNLAGAFESGSSVNLNVNSLGAANLANSIEDISKQIYLLHISSATEPRNFSEGLSYESEYSRTKHMGTQVIKDAITNEGLNARIARVHNCYGQNQPANRFVSWALNKLRCNELITLQHPLRIRDFCIVDEAANGLTMMVNGIETWQPELIEEVGTGQGISLTDAALNMCKILGVSNELVITNLNVRTDAHPKEIAVFGASSKGRCTSSFNEGIIRALGGN